MLVLQTAYITSAFMIINNHPHFGSFTITISGNTLLLSTELTINAGAYFSPFILAPIGIN